MDTPSQTASDTIPQLLAEYVSQLSTWRSERLQKLHNLIVANFPDTSLSMKYRMPTYALGDGWVALASQQSYLSLYTCAREHIQPYLDRHPSVKCGTGCLNFRDSDDIAFEDLRPVIASALKMRSR
ncbi:DUF1801 domain-containing protein [Microbulbifer sp. HZ11]|uniref:DUF1801 domain-containing protein n=1 Tax=Microbulbifer sp. HZ11 TaxID=1453501 RepID=UPI00068B89FB|nr:DUF1801 domain-containing protein [Microbulbifer sp. HZ11]